MKTYYFHPSIVTRDMHRKDSLLWGRMYKVFNQSVMLLDRTGGLQQPIHQSLYEVCALPTLREAMSYKECCDARAVELIEHSRKVGKPLGIMWSGGIDSTNILVSLMRNYSIAELKDCVKIILSTEARKENNEFYKHYVLPNFEFINSETLPWLFDGSLIIVSGEFNDQLFGSDMMRPFILKYGEDFKSKFNKDTMFKYISNAMDDAGVASVLCDSILASSDKVGITLEKNSDWFWWLNFCYKWQNVHFRIYNIAMETTHINSEWDKTHVKHFYQSEEFQLWSMNNPQVREIADWKLYKREAKQLIYEFDMNERYYLNKIKMPSLFTVFRQRDLNEYTTDDFSIGRRFVPEDFYNPNNDFRLVLCN
jgi:hypothetical protein